MSVSFVEKPSRDEFAKLVIEAADRAGIAGIKYDQKDFTLWYKCSGGTAGLFLGNFYANSRILLPQLFAGLRLSGNPVVCLPNAQTLLVTGSHDHTGIRRMLKKSAEIARTDPRPDSPAPLILKNGRIEDFAVPADSPLYEAVEFSSKDAEYLCYQRQKESLDVLYAKHEKDIFVASSHLATPNEGEDGECFSYAVWSKGVHALLPKLDKIAFNDPGAPESHRLLAMARWEDVAALLGDMLQDTHMFPERFFVSEFPSDQQLETLRRMQTDSRPQPALK